MAIKNALPTEAEGFKKAAPGVGLGVCATLVVWTAVIEVEVEVRTEVAGEVCGGKVGIGVQFVSKDNQNAR
jgi:hypothetical protein